MVAAARLAAAAAAMVQVRKFPRGRFGRPRAKAVARRLLLLPRHERRLPSVAPASPPPTLAAAARHAGPSQQWPFVHARDVAAPQQELPALDHSRGPFSPALPCSVRVACP